MNIQLKTTVRGHYKQIMARFDRQLFEALAPPFPKMEIVEFSGSREGDVVHIRFKGPVRVEWISRITEDGETDDEAWFTDEGERLPFPLTYWRHRHIVRRLTDETSCIVDDISFCGPNPVVTWLLYPLIWLGFWPRKRVYRGYFGEAASA